VVESLHGVWDGQEEKWSLVLEGLVIPVRREGIASCVARKNNERILGKFGNDLEKGFEFGVQSE
jgi:hypothetical protein